MLSVLQSVLDDAWESLTPEERGQTTKSLVASRILEVAATGERNPVVAKRVRQRSVGRVSEISVALTGGCSSAVIQLAANPRAGPFKMALCSYMPGEPILKQTWQPPTVKKCTSFWHKADMQRCAANVRFQG